LSVHNGARPWLRHHEKGAKEHEMPAHQLLSSYCRVHQKNKSTPDDLKHRHIIVNTFQFEKETALTAGDKI